MVEHLLKISGSELWLISAVKDNNFIRFGRQSSPDRIILREAVADGSHWWVRLVLPTIARLRSFSWLSPRYFYLVCSYSRMT
jgi:hypothetical protein